jgi:hypothetical protein
MIFVGVGISILLAWTAWQLPIGEPLEIGTLSLKIDDTLSILGRAFTIRDNNRPLLVVIYLTTTVWLAGSYFTRPHVSFVPLALGIVALLSAALSVEPFLYAALIIEIAILLSVPLLVPPGTRPGRGVYRFLTYQTFGMPFILITGWMLAGVEASPTELDLVVRAALLMGLGFAFLLAVIPFHSWLPMLAEESHPFVVAFLFFMLPGVILLFGLGFLDRYAFEVTWEEFLATQQ